VHELQTKRRNDHGVMLKVNQLSENCVLDVTDIVVKPSYSQLPCSRPVGGPFCRTGGSGGASRFPRS
jgi:hypothetical protein